MVVIICILLLFLFLLVLFVKRSRASSKNLSRISKKMDNIFIAHKKKYFFGYVHTNNYRPPKAGDWYQSESELIPVLSNSDWTFTEENYKSRCRWILQKDTKGIIKPQVELFHSLPYQKEKKITEELETEDNTVRVSRQWLRAMLTNGRPNVVLEPLIEGMTINLIKNLITSGFKILLDEPIMEHKIGEFWESVVKKSNGIPIQNYGSSDIKIALKVDSEKPKCLRYGAATICNYALDGSHLEWYSGKEKKGSVVCILENVLFDAREWQNFQSTTDILNKIKTSSIDPFVVKWLQQISEEYPTVIVTALPEHIANEVYYCLKENNIPIKYIFSRKKKEINTTTGDTIKRIVEDLPAQQIRFIIDSISNGFTWEFKYSFKKITVYRI